jgi:hypothetical protein
MILLVASVAGGLEPLGKDMQEVEVAEMGFVLLVVVEQGVQGRQTLEATEATEALEDQPLCHPFLEVPLVTLAVAVAVVTTTTVGYAAWEELMQVMAATAALLHPA